MLPTPWSSSQACEVSVCGAVADSDPSFGVLAISVEKLPPLFVERSARTFASLDPPLFQRIESGEPHSAFEPAEGEVT